MDDHFITYNEFPGCVEVLKLNKNEKDITEKMVKIYDVQGNNSWIGRTFRKYEDPENKFLILNCEQKNFKVFKKNGDIFNLLEYEKSGKFNSKNDKIIDHLIDKSGNLIYLTQEGNLIKENFDFSDLSKEKIKTEVKGSINLKSKNLEEDFISLACCPKSEYLAINSRTKTVHMSSRIIIVKNKEKEDFQILASLNLKKENLRFFQSFNFGDYLSESSILLFGMTSSLKSKLVCFLVEGELIELQKIVNVGARFPVRISRIEQNGKKESKMLVSDQNGRIFNLGYE